MKTLLANITVGHTTTINGHVVTRWSQASFEVDTWGRKTVAEMVQAVKDYLTTDGESA